MIINPQSDVTFLGTTLTVGDDTKFPPYPRNGDFSFLDGVLHIFGTVDNVTTWYPISVQNQYYIHVQEEEDNVWTINHNLDDSSLIVMAYNIEGLLVESNRVYLSPNTLELHLPNNVSGKAIIYVPKEDGDFELDSLFAQKADKTDVYTRLEVDTKDALKADVTQVYFQSVLDSKFSTKAAKGNTSIQLTGDVTGSGYVSNDGSHTLTLSTEVQHDSHTHDTRYYTELEMDTKLGTKLNATTFNAANILTKVKTVDGAGSGLDADQLDGHDSEYFSEKLMQSSNDFTSGILITTDIDVSMTDGPSINFEIIGKSYSTSQPPIRVEGQCYIYHDNIQNQSAITYNSNITSIYLLKDANGRFCIWIPRISYWNSFVATVWVSSTGDVLTNRTISYADVAKPSSTKEVHITPFVLMHSGNYTPPTSTAFDSGHSFATNGYQKLSNGFITQWGNVNYTTSGQTVYFPVAFPHACLALALGDVTASSYSSDGSMYINGKTATYFKLNGRTSNVDASYIAVGY